MDIFRLFQASARLQGALAEVEALSQQNRILISQRERFIAEAGALERERADLTMQCRALLRYFPGQSQLQ
jgi:hypothetical protein